ncbi:sigma-54 interaction domain-containing protein [Marinomonas posidonica]|uniref:Sigma54 specific transcriptional regulator, Fis family n=1 Tax=Marinomonas posidonica (strain CECT 7376 / NCIMB 14433 / IVIA-Po-181) TaxID=491952 RepID=F6CVH9_MARPP|nr:sigma-54 dependent transcriptional regulator [Marinomonas posidonica]AEF55356.1 sigma54 specific transcriptional regulator, Fis family [Marinomonas posidonica IVIA-Po-181]
MKTAPKLFLQIQQPELATELLALPSLRQFELTISQQGHCWLAQLADSQCDLAIIEANAEQQNQLQALSQSSVLDKVQCLFLSQGEPSMIMDHLMGQGAGVHYRAPFNFTQLKANLDELFWALDPSPQAPSPQTSYLDQFGLLVGSSPCMHQLYRTLRKVAATNANTFLIGESGTGKELVANTLHLFSQRSDQAFIAVNCAALSPELIDSELFGHVKGAFTGAHKDHIGVFEQAEGGTLFLDEVTEMPYEHQAKLLRVLESGEYRPVGSQSFKQAKVRVVAATNRTPKDAIDEEKFREDLYFRLAHFPIQVPPLRNRQGDAVGLAQHFLAYRNTQDHSNKALSSQAINKIAQYQWPGNVRELKHTIERAFILAEQTILPEHIVTGGLADAASDSQSHIPAGMPLEDIEKMAILKTLADNQGNRNNTAQQLGISVKTLYNKLDKYGTDSLAHV